MTTMSLGGVDRYLVPVEDRRAIRFFVDQLFVPSNRRDWIWSRLVPWSVGLGGSWSLLRNCPTNDSRTLLGSDVPDWLRRELSGALDTEKCSWIALRSRAGSGRKLIIFFFREREEQPFAVLKIGSKNYRRSLARERDALCHLHRRLPVELATTVPAPLAFARREGTEALLLGFVPGRSLEAEIARRFPSPKTVTTHFESTVSWLACFHITTRSERRIELGDQKLQLSLSASHGDFSARNVLARYRHRAVGGPPLAVSGIVDWERFSPQAPPYEDLFHFALTYALCYPWPTRRGEGTSSAFRLAFLEETPLAKAILAGLSTYCDLTDVPFEALKPLFARHLRRAPWDDLGLRLGSERSPAFGESC